MDAGDPRRGAQQGRGPSRWCSCATRSRYRNRRGNGREAGAAAAQWFRRAVRQANRTSNGGARDRIVGNIYKGVVDNVLPGMEAAFVDIGLERNGFLHVDEIVLPDGQKIHEARPRPRPADRRRADQPKLEVRVQVVQGPAEELKGARLSMQIGSPAATSITMPSGGEVGASRRLPDTERDRQRKLLQKLHKADGGVIVRTAATRRRASPTSSATSTTCTSCSR